MNPWIDVVGWCLVAGCVVMLRWELPRLFAVLDELDNLERSRILAKIEAERQGGGQ